MAGSQISGLDRSHRKGDQATDANTPLDNLGLAKAGDVVKSITVKTNASAVSEYVFVYDAVAVPSASYEESDDLICILLAGASWNKTFPLCPPDGITLANGLVYRVCATSDGSTAITAGATVDVSFEIEEA